MAEPVTLSPHQLVLNAKQAEDIQAVIGMSMPSGYTLTGFDVKLKIADNPIEFQAFSFRYCAIDDNFLARFDRQEITEDPYIQSLAGSTVTAIVYGSYTAVSADGLHIINIEFEGSDSMTILRPGKGRR